MTDVKDAAAMTAGDVQHAREVLRLTREQLAAELGVVPDVVAAFEAGSLRVPPRIAKVLRWRVALEERERVLEAAGHGPCPVSVSLAERFTAPGADMAATMKAFEAHTAECARCQARAAFADTLPPLPSAPTSAMGRAFGAFVGFTERLPGWARPAAWGAAVIGAIVLLRVLLTLLSVGPSWRLLGMGVLGIALGAYLGAVGGITYHFVQPRAQRLGGAAPYVTAIACTLAYMLAFMVPSAVMGESVASSPGDWIAAGVIAVFFGLVLGFFFRKTGA